MICVVVSVLIGMVLGQRFKVLVLAPASGLVLIAALAVGIAEADPPGRIAFVAAAAITGLQLGYLIGATLRHLMVMARLSRRRSDPIAVPARRSTS